MPYVIVKLSARPAEDALNGSRSEGRLMLQARPAIAAASATDCVETCAQFIGPDGRMFLIHIVRGRGTLLVRAGYTAAEPVRVSAQRTVEAAKAIAAQWVDEFRRSQVLRETAIDHRDRLPVPDPNALYWSRRGEIACAAHAPLDDGARWDADRWTTIAERPGSSRMRYQCSMCHGGPVRHVPRTQPRPSSASPR
jgi:hypothetical protein